MAKWPYLYPLEHWETINRIRFQSYRIDHHRTQLISDDARISVERRGYLWIVYVDGVELHGDGLLRQFETEEAAVDAAIEQLFFKAH